MKDTSRTSQLSKSPDRASLDRIDSSKGYVKGNVQFVSYMANCAKNEFTSAKLKHFCESMVKHCENMHWVEDELVGQAIIIAKPTLVLSGSANLKCEANINALIKA